MIAAIAASAGAPKLVRAEDGKSRSRLFSGLALEKAEQRHRRAIASKRGTDFSGTAVNEAAELDTVDTILEDRKGEDFFSRYRGPFYMTYVYEALPLGDIEDTESKSLAERALVYQAATTFSRVVVKSALEPLYRDAVERLKQFRSYTSLKLRQEEDGGLGVDDSESEKPLVEFKLSVGVNYGVEPRVDIGENCSFRYDLFRETTFFEFRQDF